MSVLIGDNADNAIEGTDSDDLIVAGNGDDTVNAGDGDDLVISGRGDDEVDAGSGDDIVLAGSGDDTVIHVEADNLDTSDIYFGGSGYDTLRLIISQATFDSAEFQADLASFQAMIDQKGTASGTFASLGIEFHSFENIEIVNQPPTVALADTTTSLDEDTDTTSAIKVADIVVTDDGLGINNLTLSGADAALFEIVGSELHLKAGSVLDFETNPSLDVTVEVDDPAVGTAPDDTASLSIAVGDVNELPQGVVLITGTAEEDQTLTADASGLTDDDGIGPFSYQWQRSTDGGATFADIVSATASTYTLGDADVGTQVQVVVGYTDGQGTAESVTSAPTAAVANINDDPAGAVLIVGADLVTVVAEGEMLAVNASGLSDDDGIGPFSYQWQRSTDGGATFADIVGATASTYTLGGVDVGAQVQVVLSYTDGQGTAESVASGPTATVLEADAANPALDAAKIGNGGVIAATNARGEAAHELQNEARQIATVDNGQFQFTDADSDSHTTTVVEIAIVGNQDALGGVDAFDFLTLVVGQGTDTVEGQFALRQSVVESSTAGLEKGGAVADGLDASDQTAPPSFVVGDDGLLL